MLSSPPYCITKNVNQFSIKDLRRSMLDVIYLPCPLYPIFCFVLCCQARALRYLRYQPEIYFPSLLIYFDQIAARLSAE